MADGCLDCGTILMSALSVISVVIAFVTTDWIRIEEKFYHKMYDNENGTEEDYELTVRSSSSGLLKTCVQTSQEAEVECTFLHPLEDKNASFRMQGTFFAAQHAVQQSLIFFIVGVCVQILGEIGIVCGQCIKDKRICNLIGGTVFVISGLIMMIAVITYVSVFKIEIASKFKGKSLASPSLTFHYGYSFVFYICGFICAQLTGACGVFLFISDTRPAQPFYPVSMYRNPNCELHPYADTIHHPCKVHPDIYVIPEMDHYLPYYYHYHHPQYQRENRAQWCGPFNNANDSPPYTPAQRTNDGQTRTAEYIREDGTHRTIGLQVNVPNRNGIPDNIASRYIDGGVCDHNYVPFDLKNFPARTTRKPEARKTTLV